MPAQVATFSSETRLIIVNVSVKDKMGNPVLDLKKEDFEITEDGKKQDPNVFNFEKLTNDLLTPIADEDNAPKQLEERVAAPKPAAPKPVAAAPATVILRWPGKLPAQRQAPDGDVLRHDHHAAVRPDPGTGERHQVRQGTDDVL